MKNGSNSTAILAERGIILMFFGGGGGGDKYCKTVSVRKMAKLTMTFNQFFLGRSLYGSLGRDAFHSWFTKNCSRLHNCNRKGSNFEPAIVQNKATKHRITYY